MASKKKFSIGKLLSTLDPDLGAKMLDAAATLAAMYRDDPTKCKSVKQLLRGMGMSVYSLPDDSDIDRAAAERIVLRSYDWSGTAFVYWTDDPTMKEVFNASFEELPEFLSHEDPGIRQLAKWRLDDLNK